MGSVARLKGAFVHHPIPLSNPDISELEHRLVRQVLDSGRLSIGPMVERFEGLVAERVGVDHAVAVSSGTAGLQLILAGLGIGPGDEVITTPFSFIASANVIVHAGATPVFVDICPKSLNMDPKLVERAITPKTRAILAVEAFGNPAHMETLAQIAGKHDLLLIEDSCEALGTTHRGRACGAFGRAGVFGFYPNKQITTGEGGMIVTDDARLADACRSLRNQGRAPGSGGTGTGSWLKHERFGFNCRMSELSAALGVGQMTRLDELIERRQKVASSYMDRLLSMADIVAPTVDPETFMSWFVFVVRLGPSYSEQERDRVVSGLRNHDVGSAAYFPCIHLEPPYRERFGFGPGSFPIAESVSSRTVALPFYNGLSPREIDLVIQTLEVMVGRENLTRG